MHIVFCKKYHGNKSDDRESLSFYQRCEEYISIATVINYIDAKKKEDLTKIKF